MRGHNYKHRKGSYIRGRSRSGRYYTHHGCMLPILLVTLFISIVIYYI